MLPQNTIKIVLVGDGAIGKTSLVLTYVTDAFPEGDIPFCAESCIKNKMVNGNSFTLELWDLPDKDGYDTIRPLCYPRTDVVIICFSIAEPSSFESVTEKWYPEVIRNCPYAPTFLVGTKLDSRNDEKILEDIKSRGLTPVTTSQGLETKKAIGAFRYIECSSLTGENLETIFDEVLRVVLVAGTKRKRKCVIL